MNSAAYAVVLLTLLIADTVHATRREYAIVSVKVEDYKTLNEVHLDLLEEDNAVLASDLGAFILTVADRETSKGYTTRRSLVATLNTFADHGFEVLSTATVGETLVYTLAKSV